MVLKKVIMKRGGFPSGNANGWIAWHWTWLMWNQTVKRGLDLLSNTL